jgi:hypothetical protein
MEHEEWYHGRRIVLTTEQLATRVWTFRAVLHDDEGRASLVVETGQKYGSEEEARRAALSAAAAAVDRDRTARGKP